MRGEPRIDRDIGLARRGTSTRVEPEFSHLIGLATHILVHAQDDHGQEERNIPVRVSRLTSAWNIR